MQCLQRVSAAVQTVSTLSLVASGIVYALL